MKNFAFLTGMLFYSVAFSQNSSLSLSLQDSSMFRATLNGTDYSDASNVMNFFDLKPGNQQLKVFKLLKTGNSIIQQSVFDGLINLPSGRNTIAYIDKYNQFKVSNTTALEQQNQQNSTSRSPYFIPNPQRIKAYDQPTTSASGMNNDQFAGQMETLKSINNESTRYESAKGIVSLGTFNSNQLAEMMLIFNSERNRINLANFGYDYVVDKSNFGVVYNALRYPSSIKKLTRKIN